MSSTPVGYLYTPQQLAGSLKFGSGVRLGNWQEDEELDNMRMANYIEAKENGSLVVLKKAHQLQPQLAPAALTAPPADGHVRYGDTVLLRSFNTEGYLAVSLGNKLPCEDAELYGVSVCPPETGAAARTAVKFASYEGIPDGEPVRYGDKVTLEFSSDLPRSGYLSSMRANRTCLSTTLVNKQDVYMQVTDGSDQGFEYSTSKADRAWTVLAEKVDDRILAQGTPVPAGAPLTFVHCFTQKRLAAVMMGQMTEFGREFGVCAHTYTPSGKVNKLMREATGKPTSSLITRSETDENFWSIVYA